MRISKIILNNFRGYKHAEIDFNRFNCIVGKNDVGKSTIFEAIKWFFDKSQNDADRDINSNKVQNEEIEDNISSSFDKINFDRDFNLFFNNYLDSIYTMSVEIRFCEVDDFKDKLKNFFSTTQLYFVKTDDFLNEEKELCIRKEIKHSRSLEKITPWSNNNITVPKYQILTKQYRREKPISLWTLKMLEEEYAMIDNYDAQLLNSFHMSCLQDESFYKQLSDVHEDKRFPLSSKPFLQEILEQIRNYYSKNGNLKFEWESFDRNRTDYLAVVPKFRYFDAVSFETELDIFIQDYITSFLSQTKILEEIQKTVSDEFQEISYELNRIINSPLTLIPKVTTTFKVDFEFSNDNGYINIKNRGAGIQYVLMNILFRYISDKDNGMESIIAFEEPEAHLHPEAQIKFFDSIYDLSEQYNQVIITTHSPLIVSMCDTKDIIHIKKNNDYPKVYQNDKLPLLEVIEDLGIGPNDDLLSIYDTYKSILFVEGKNDIYTLRTISEKYKTAGKISETFDEMGCLMIPFGGCSTVEEWANLGIVTKLAKPFVILLDSDKKNSGHISNNQKKLDNIYKTLNDSIGTSKQAKINFCKDNFITTRKRELENYIRPNAIKNYYNKNSDKSISDEEFEDIQDIMERIKNVELSIIAFVYKYDNKSIKKNTTEALENIPFENRKEKARQIRKEKTIVMLTNYTQEYQKSDSEFQFKEWLYCKVKGIDINHYAEYKDVIIFLLYGKWNRY